ncbi:MAG: ADP-ribosylglycohydrolase family protein [Chloracidobacterium sp.]|nr:ADP-ribosylglycohydrolase family protein [Chloracidobacterium sp.]
MSRSTSRIFNNTARFKGCLLGGAVGDALGAAVEFDTLDRIRERFGESGLADYAPAYGRLGAITDDTQMTLFTAEGLLRADQDTSLRIIDSIYQSYLAWLYTQRIVIDERFAEPPARPPGWLVTIPELNARRAAGRTCLSALRSGRKGTVTNPLNNSKGCGGVMRVAPVGLIAENPFILARDAAAITHGHPAGYLSAGVLALIISNILNGRSLADAINHAVYEEFLQHSDFEETFVALDRAVKLAYDRSVEPSPETIESLGGGWVGEEALAISIYCSLVHENDFGKAILLSVNHSGDSDSTGAITGNIIGALHGIDAIPSHWLERLELRTVIEQVADDLDTATRGANLS